MNLKKELYNDFYRASHNNVNFKNFIKYILFVPSYKYVFWLRINMFMNNKFKLNPIRIISRLLLRRYQYKYGIEIPPYTNIGSGFLINHIGGIVINPNAIIGKNCNISNNVTIGQSNRGKRKGTPKIGDNVFIAPGAKIIGNITIGDNVSIGANAVVISDIPNNGVAVGSPAKVVSMNGSKHYVEDII